MEKNSRLSRMIERRVARAAGIAAALIVMSGVVSCIMSCASGPAAIPSWTVHTPDPDAVNTFFTGSGTGRTAAEALENAQSNLVASVMQYMGTQVNVQTSATARASLDNYQAELIQSVSTESSGRLSGFRIKDKQVYADKKSGTVQAYILATYSTVELNKERTRMDDMAREKVDAVAVPETAGDSLFAEGRASQAVRKFLEAAIAATAPGVDNPRQKVERNLSKARAAVAALSLSIDGPSTGESGKTPEKPFSVLVLARSASLLPSSPAPAAPSLLSPPSPAADVAISLSLPRKLASGKIGSRTELLRSDRNGRVVYAASAPDFSGSTRVSAALDLQAELDLAYSLPKEYSAIVAALENDIASRTVDIDWKIVSAARGIPLAVAIFETDQRGYSLADRPMSGGLQEALRAAGFTVMQIASLSPAILLSGDDTAVLAAARAAGVPAFAARITYGAANIDAVASDGSMFIATASGGLKTLDLASGALLHSASRSAQGIGATEDSA
ncbi:MAG: hypothetical protein WBH97_02280, partial [Rectinemataceae bacterium]